MELKQTFEECVQKLNHLWNVYNELLDDDLIDACIYEIQAIELMINSITTRLKITTVMQ